MIKRIQTTLLALLAILGSVSAQTLSVQPIEAQTGEQTEVVVNLTGGTAATALQFNLKLPEGVTVNANSATLGAAIDGHTLSVQTLASGDLLFILYSMDLKTFKNGELLRIPVKAGDSATSATGQLYTVRTATVSGEDAVSHTCSDAQFNVVVKVPEPAITVTADNKTMTYGDNVPALTYKAEGGTLNGTPNLSTTATKTSDVGSYPIKAEAGSVTNTKVTYVDGTLTIEQASLTVTANNFTITQGDALPTFTASYSGFRNGNTENVLTKKPMFTCSATNSETPGVYEITASGAEAKNYAMTYVKGTLTITKKDEPEPEGFSNNKLYTLTCKRGGLVLNDAGTGLAAGQTRTDAPESDKHFAIITYNDAQYLYSPVNKQYLLYDGSFVSRLGTPITFDEGHPDGDYKYMLLTKNAADETIYFNNNGNIVINGWDTPDDGNRWIIEPVADFDPTEALALAGKQICTVTYEVKYEGQVVATAMAEVAIGGALPAVPASLNNSFVTLEKSGTHPKSVNDDITVTFKATWNGPFQFSKTLDAAKWYNMHIRSGYYVGKQETEPYYPIQNAGDALKTKEYHWAFGGNPYHVKVYNRTTGLDETLAKDGDNAVMRAGDYSWDLLPNSDGFVLRVAGTENSCINQYGGTSGPLKFWTDGNSLTDDGSTFRVEEAQEPYDGVQGIQHSDDKAQELYDLSGRRIGNGNLNKGIYIRNRRKVLVK